MITVDVTYNVRLIKSIVTDPKLFPMIINDPKISPETWNPSWDQIYLIVQDEKNIYGLFLLYKFMNTSYFVHSLLLPKYWGKDISKDAAEAGFQFLRENSDITKLISKVPEICKEVCVFLERTGFKQEGRLTKAIDFLGTNMDLFLYSYDLRGAQ